MGNPGALLILALGIVLVVLGFKGHSDNLIAAATGKPYRQSTIK